MIGKEAGQVRDDNTLKMKLVWCAPGSFNMESVEYIERNGEKLEIRKPVRTIITKGFWLGKFEVTQQEWKGVMNGVMNSEPWKDQPGVREGHDFPATYISWNDATDFCRKLTEQERVAGRLTNTWEYTLPNEAQWERACRARTDSDFSFGDDAAQLGEYAWFLDNARNAGEDFAHRVGQKKPNAWGLFDTHGNVREWCRDVFADDPPGGIDPEVTAEDQRAFRVQGKVFRVDRGGDWSSYAEYCRSSRRALFNAVDRRKDRGFRVALSLVRPVVKEPAP
jgi:formylglycine-generating enzyme required for sulfatase activity